MQQGTDCRTRRAEFGDQRINLLVNGVCLLLVRALVVG